MRKLKLIIEYDGTRFVGWQRQDNGLSIQGEIEKVLREILQESIDVVGAASDGLEALEKARSLRPEVILMDVQMPRCDGLAATRLIKAELPEIKNRDADHVGRRA